VPKKKKSSTKVENTPSKLKSKSGVKPQKKMKPEAKVKRKKKSSPVSNAKPQTTVKNPQPKKQSVKKDPYFERETELYEHPVPSREFILGYLRERKKPAAFEHMVSDFKLTLEPERVGLQRRLSAMLRDGQLAMNRNNRYLLVDQESLIAGFVQAHRDGFGWLIPESGGPDIFLPARQMRQVFADDRVLVRVVSKKGRRSEGAIVEVLERNTQYVAGRLHQENGISFVDPDSKSIVQEIMIPPGSENGAKAGQYVVVKIVSQPSLRRQPIGEIVEVLGDQLTPGLEVELAVRAHNLPFQFPALVLSETSGLPDQVVLDKNEKRRDLRDLHFVTIDGEDARDFDDAVYCEPLKNGGWRAYVAIADVAHYVTPNSELDKEAQLRGNSVYFPARVIPMLPEKLSNDLCSLRPHCDRLVMVCEMELNSDGIVKKYAIDNGVIHSKARLTYTTVAAILEGKEKADEVLHTHLNHLHQLFQKLYCQRQLRGAIEFDTTETQIQFGAGGKIDRIVPRYRNVAHRIIEELMLLANETTSKHLEKSGIATLYRVHDLPDPERLQSLRDFLKTFSLRLGGGDAPTPLDYSKLLDRVVKRPEAHLIQTVMLRSMKQAIYSPDSRGHFGLSYESYCHFTSPIRRYPDLLVHRALKHLINKRKTTAFHYDVEHMSVIGEHCSMTERRADRASRDATDWLKCDYMKDKEGQTFDGFISDVTGFGIFVELKDIFVQGLVHVTALKNDYYQFESVNHLLRGRASNRTYRLGDAVRVQVARVDVDQRKIDFILG
jgi:ribonuclease R